MSWRRVSVALTVVALSSACHHDSGDDGASDGIPVQTESADSVAVDTVAAGLEVPWALAVAPDGRIFVTERGGRVRVIENGKLRAEPWATIGVTAVGEAGLMGIALPPDF